MGGTSGPPEFLWLTLGLWLKKDLGEHTRSGNRPGSVWKPEEGRAQRKVGCGKRVSEHSKGNQRQGLQAGRTAVSGGGEVPRLPSTPAYMLWRDGGGAPFRANPERGGARLRIGSLRRRTALCWLRRRRAGGLVRFWGALWEVLRRYRERGKTAASASAKKMRRFEVNSKLISEYFGIPGEN